MKFCIRQQGVEAVATRKYLTREQRDRQRPLVIGEADYLSVNLTFEQSTQLSSYSRSGACLNSACGFGALNCQRPNAVVTRVGYIEIYILSPSSLLLLSYNVTFRCMLQLQGAGTL